MKIVYLAKTSLPSRTANSLHVMKMCQAFAKNGHEVWLCVLNENSCNDYSDEEIFSYYAVDNVFHLLQVPVFPDQGSKFRFLLSHLCLIPGIVKKLREIQPDIVYGRDIFSCYIAACAGEMVVAESHFPLWSGTVASLAFNRLVKSTKFLGLVVISEALKKAYLQYYPNLAPRSVLVAHDGADAVENRKINNLDLGRQGYLQVGYIGHLYKGKGVEVIAEIAPRMPEIDFHIIGGLESDIELWKKRIKENNVVFHGFVQQQNLPDYLNALDVCLLPNQKKVFAYGADSNNKEKNISLFTSPLKMFEYMAYGKAIIASDLPVLKEVLTDDVAILVQPEDYSGWIAAINEFRDAGERNKKGTMAQQLFLREYTWTKRADSVLKNTRNINYQV